MKDLRKNIFEVEICKERDSKKLWLSQHSYVERVLERFNMGNEKLVSTL